MNADFNVKRNTLAFLLKHIIVNFVITIFNIILIIIFFFPAADFMHRLSAFVLIIDENVAIHELSAVINIQASDMQLAANK